MNHVAQTEKESTHLEGVIYYGKDLNTDLSNLVDRADALCNKLGRNNYSKNQQQPSIEKGSPMPDSDGITDDFRRRNDRQNSLQNDLRTAIEYLEMHI